MWLRGLWGWVEAKVKRSFQLWDGGVLFKIVLKSKRSYGVCDWGRTHIAVERKPIRSGENIVPI
jgi:hypothetical protein